jgi:putative holliday junction resolvase
VARVVCLDVGSKRIGVAVSDDLGILATPRGAIHRQSYNKDAAAIATLVQEFEAGCVVVGLPLGLSGQDTDQTRRVRQFAEMLASRLSVSVELWDETLTTVAAEAIAPMDRAARQAGLLDAVAAAVILQGFLDHQARSSASSSSSSSPPWSAADLP